MNVRSFRPHQAMSVARVYRYVAASLLIIASRDVHGQGTATRGSIDGVVTDSALAPISGAIVSIDGVSVNLTTGPNGRFQFLALPSGSYELRIRRIGFAPTTSHVRVVPADTVRIAITLDPSTVVLDSVRVTALVTPERLLEFEERRARGEGQFLTAAEIERRNTVSVSDLLMTFNGVTLQSGTRAINRRYGAMRDCPFQVFIDDVRVPTPNLRDEVVSPRHLAGIEVYTSIASVPLRYRSAGDASACGVILLWSKRGGQ